MIMGRSDGDVAIAQLVIGVVTDLALQLLDLLMARRFGFLEADVTRMPRTPALAQRGVLSKPGPLSTRRG
jgi:hypothetical protein